MNKLLTIDEFLAHYENVVKHAHSLSQEELEYIVSSRLRDQQKKVLDLRLDGFTYAEIGKEMNLSVGRIRQILAKTRRIVWKAVKETCKEDIDE